MNEILCVMGLAGDGKSSLAMQSPGPHAIICIDKPVVAPLPPGWPGYDPTQDFYRTYPPPERDLTDAKALPSRNIFDAIQQDLQGLKNGLIQGGDTIKMQGWRRVSDEQAVDEILMPRTIIIEGGDFLRDHAINWVCHTNGVHHMDEFTTSDGKPNPFLGWGLTSSKMEEVLENITFFPSIRPVNIVLTIGLHEESKNTRENGRSVSVKTGVLDPAFGGKMALEGPRKFKDCWLATRVGSNWFVITSQTAKYSKFRGLRSGRFGLAPEIDITLNMQKPVNQWDRLFRLLTPALTPAKQ